MVRIARARLLSVGGAICSEGKERCSGIALWDARIGVVCSPNGAGGRGHSQGVSLRVLAQGMKAVCVIGL